MLEQEPLQKASGLWKSHFPMQEQVKTLKGLWPVRKTHARAEEVRSKEQQRKLTRSKAQQKETTRNIISTS